MKACRSCGGSEVDGHEPDCPEVLIEFEAVRDRQQSTLRPPPPNHEGRQGVIHHGASTAVTYTTESRGRGVRLQIPPRLLQGNQGTMTREEYLAWQAEA